MELTSKQKLDDYIKGIATEIGQATFAEFRKEQEAKAVEMRSNFEAQLATVREKTAPTVTVEKGTMAARIIRTCLVGKAIGQPGAEKFAKEAYGDGADVVLKALSTSPGGAGGYIIPPQYSTDLIELLYNQTAVRKLGAVVYPMANGNLTIPKLTAGVSASYVGENASPNAVKPTFGVVTLSWKKLRATVAMSNDLLRFANPRADEIVKNDILNAFRVAEDATFLRSDGTGVTPKGLLSWCIAANTFAAQAAVYSDADKVLADLHKAILKLEAANIPFIKPGWIFAPRTKHFLMQVRLGTTAPYPVFADEMSRGTLLGYPFVATAQVPVNIGGTNSEIYLADFNDVVIGESSELLVDSSNEAAYLDEAGVLTSAFANDQTVIRAIARHDFAMRRVESLAIINTVPWL